MLFATFALVSLFVSASANPAFFFPKVAPKVAPSRPQVGPAPKPNPIPKDKPDQPQGNPAPAQAQAQAQAQANNVGGLNNRLKKAEDVVDLLDIGNDIAQAILGTAPSTTVLATTVTVPTAWATDFAPCKSYASILSSCAAATTSFYNLEYDKQASCVCYEASTNTAACQAVPKFVTSYDDYEYGCYDFFNSHSAFQMIARAMNDSIALPGPELCSWAPSEYTMYSTLPPSTISCPTATPTRTASAPAQTYGNGGGAARLLTTFDRSVLMAFAAITVGIWWLVFQWT